LDHRITAIRKKVEGVKTIVVRLPNWVGDIVMVSPSLRNLKESFPNHRFIATGRPYSKQILSANKIFDGFISKPEKGSGPSAYKSYLNSLRSLGPSAGILYTNSFSSAIDFFLAGISFRLGYRNEMRSFFLSESIEMVPGAMDDKYAELTHRFGATLNHHQLELGLDEKCQKIYEIVSRKHSILDEETLIGFNPGAGFGETKKWLTEYFIELGKLLADALGPVRFLVFGGPGDEHRAEQISEGLGGLAINLSRESLGLHNIKPFFKRMNLFITNDSGLRWYSLAMGKPTIVLFGPSDPDLTQCFTENTFPIQHKVSCAPCKHRVCPIGFDCMRDLTPQKVFDLTHDLYSKKIWN